MGMVAALASIKPEIFEKMQNQKKGFYDFSEEVKTVYIDKTWEAMGFILTGSCGRSDHLLSEIIDPIGKIVTHKDQYMEEFVSFNDPEKVKLISKELESISTDAFRKLFEQRDLQKNNIYPNIWTGSEENFHYLLDCFNQIKDLYKSASAQNEYVFISID